MRKWILRIVLGVVVLVILAALGVWVMIDSLAEQGIRQGGTYALGVPTDVEDVNLSLVKGALAIDGLVVGNPTGFASPHLMKSGRFDLQVDTGSVLGQTIRVHHFVLDGLDINLESHNGKTNISAVMENIRRLGGQDDKPKTDESAKKVAIGKVVIRNVVANVHLPSLLKNAKPLSIRVPEIELANVASDNPDGIPVAQLMARLLPAVLAAVLERGQDVLPADLLKDMNKDVASAAQAMGDTASGLVRQVGGEAADVLRAGTTQTIKTVGTGVDGVVKGVLNGVLPPAKKEEPNK